MRMGKQKEEGMRSRGRRKKREELRIWCFPRLHRTEPTTEKLMKEVLDDLAK